MKEVGDDTKYVLGELQLQTENLSVREILTKLQLFADLQLNLAIPSL